jgi:hypothetical protein
MDIHIEVMIWKMVHELKMADICSTLKKTKEEMSRNLSYLQNRAYYPYRRISTIDNAYYQHKLDKYVHYKKLSKCMLHVIKPTHIFFD